MEKELMSLIVGLNTKDNGQMTNKMEKDKKVGQIRLYIQVNIKMVKNMVKESLCGLMIAPMRVNFLKTIFMVTEDINGKMDEFIQANGKIIKCKVKEYLLGLTEENMKVIILRIENKDMAHFFLKMAEFIKENG